MFENSLYRHFSNLSSCHTDPGRAVILTFSTAAASTQTPTSRAPPSASDGTKTYFIYTFHVYPVHSNSPLMIFFKSEMGSNSARRIGFFLVGTAVTGSCSSCTTRRFSINRTRRARPIRFVHRTFHYSITLRYYAIFIIPRYYSPYSRYYVIIPLRHNSPPKIIVA